ncbi:MAG TPA: PhoPQ-activated protein PqaA family protein [Methylomirabilota bacterium]|nr:PhoPQ-activated protein PqaA family protein [Methylomirabilota bacterium]
MKLLGCCRRSLLFLSIPVGAAFGVGRAWAGPLEDYVARPDSVFAWTAGESWPTNGATVQRIDLTSQQWREHRWQHTLTVVRPARVRNPGLGFLFITGDGRGSRELGILATVAERAGIIAAVVTRVPNQPLYDGRKEDALIAYTLDQYLKSKDPTWPLLFPMVKSAVRAMDAVQQFADRTHQQRITNWVVSGASKRGWTTWLTAAVDPRVAGIAPMVIDTLNMKAQTDWAEKVYGRQSEQIRDYTELGLVQRSEEPDVAELRGWIDPYSYRRRYTMPKLILIGSNDPYWTVDSLRHYWQDLPPPKLLHQTPNAGHDLAGGKEALPTLAAFVQMIADGHPLPSVDWKIQNADEATLSLEVNVPAKAVRLWTAESPDRDFRNDSWTSRPLQARPGNTRAVARVETPATGYRAFFGEVELTSPTGHDFKLSTEARVTPDGVRKQ